MSPRRPAAALLVLLVAGLLPRAAAGAERIAIRDVRHWSYAGYTRVVVELSAPVTTTVKNLPASQGLPDRLYLDLAGVTAGPEWAEPIPVADGLLRRVRIGQNRPGRVRVVVDLERFERHRLFTLTAPDRVVLDVFAEDREDGRDAGTDAPAHPPTRPRPRPGVRTVVIDPGHGGRDPGASGRGLREKDVTLSVALDLRDRLRARGFDVRMTRETDRTVSLEERTAMAEGVGADVFVSIHANAAPGPAAHGIETYFLDETDERHSLRVAARESGVSPAELDDLDRALAGLRMSVVSERSAELARDVHTGVVRGVGDVYGSVRDLGVKKGPFHVLFLSNAPSILVEVGFLTHRGEARRLDSRLYRAVLAEQMARGLSRYRTRQMERARSLAVRLQR